MKTRNVNLENTPLLINNICKKICLKAPTIEELKKKALEYQILLVRSLTNTYQLTSLSLDNNGRYTLLPDGNYQVSIFLNFTGIKKDLTSNPKKTLEYIKQLTAMESKSNGENGRYLTPTQRIRNFHKTEIVSIEVGQDQIETDVISTKQTEILEKLVSKTNLIKVSFLIENKKRNLERKTTSILLRMHYDAIEFVQPLIEHHNPIDEEIR